MGGKKIVIIDDDPEVRYVMREILTEHDYEVFTAEDGFSGLDALSRNNPSIIITDIRMPGMDGIEVLRKVKQQSPDTEVIVITAHGEIDLAIQALQLEASDFITKPINDQSLLVALNRAEKKIWLRNKLQEHTQDLERLVKENTEELGKRYDFEHNLIQTSMDGIIAHDPSGKVIIFNEGAECICGYKRDEVVSGIPITQLYPAGVAEEFKKMIHGPEYGGPGRLVNYEVEMLKKNGEPVSILLSATLHHETGQEVATVLYFKDMSDIKQLEQDLVRNERMAAMGLAMAGVAHGVKNILHVMNLGAYMVEMGLDKQKGELVAKGWKLVRKNVDRISKMTADMLNYARTGPAARKVYSLNVIVNEVLELMADKARESGIRLVRELDPALPLMSMDPKGIHLCLLNLLTNAIEAIPETVNDGRIIVFTRDGGEAGVRLQVKDTGMGMSKEFQKTVFERLASTKGAKGTGLGLVTTQKIVHEHGGTIQVESEPQKGSCFTITLPRPDVS